ncbi:MAG: shikimate dehydrogenase family protein [Bacteroidales bacterium]
MRIFGLLGYPLSHSFSKGYFTRKFDNEKLDACYLNFDLPDLTNFKELLKTYPGLTGMNVTIPYKEQIIPFLDSLDPDAASIGAVNVIKIVDTTDGKRLIGYNSDAKGFQDAIKPLLHANHKEALVLGTGGASKAVVFALNKLGIVPVSISRNPIEGGFTYQDLTPELIAEYQVIINTTPVGMYPHVVEKPLLPYEGITASHLCFDLIYNPEETAFLKACAQRGATVCNGYSMLIGQANEAWRIWNNQPIL